MREAGFEPALLAELPLKGSVLRPLDHSRETFKKILLLAGLEPATPSS